MLLRAMGVADLEALLSAFQVPITELLDKSKLGGASLPVGTVRVRLACVAAHPPKSGKCQPQRAREGPMENGPP